MSSDVAAAPLAASRSTSLSSNQIWLLQVQGETSWVCKVLEMGCQGWKTKVPGDQVKKTTWQLIGEKVTNLYRFVLQDD